MSATRQPSTQAQAAAAIRRELKTAFPSVTFRVHSDSFAGGDSVDIGWTDGPTTDQVTAITHPYQYGHFDGSIDLYEYSNRRDDLPQSKYVQTQRSMSDETFAAIVAHLNGRYAGYALVIDPRYRQSVTTESDQHTGSGWQSQEIHRTFSPLSLVCRACCAATMPADTFCPACGALLIEVAP